MRSRHVEFILLPSLFLSRKGPHEEVPARLVLHWRSLSADERCVRSVADCGQPDRGWSQVESNLPWKGRLHHLPARRGSFPKLKELMGLKLHVCVHRGRSQEAYLSRRVQWSSIAGQVVRLQNNQADEIAKHGEWRAKISKSNLWSDWNRRVQTEHIHKWDADQNVAWWYLARFRHEASLSCDVFASNQTAILKPQPSQNFLRRTLYEFELILRRPWKTRFVRPPPQSDG